MSISFNKIILVGRLTRDPETRFSANGTQVTFFTLAVDRNYNRDSNQDSQNTDFIRIVSFGRLAEFVSTYLSKGRLVLVEGSLRIRNWQTQSGEYRSTTEVVANSVQFMEPKPKEGSAIDLETGTSEEDVELFNDTFEDIDSDSDDSDEIPF
ncbi:MAG: single-strand DNA-binding protein [Thermotogaceae bacterium]|jgi:single-strand DNA-binding protein|nr:single-strand DNA-binding protein [Thermotogaceae bacterium]MDN5338451.1 single-strand DNA-binding protein [Thermotogaceae bacterium]